VFHHADAHGRDSDAHADTFADAHEAAVDPGAARPANVCALRGRQGWRSRAPFLDLFYDGVATNFRVLDASGQVVVRVPIAGSGIFGPETCAVRQHPPGKTEGFTYLSVDGETVQRLTANPSAYRVEADSVAGRTVTVPLTDTGCRAL
jgi:hypothetical protein